MADQIRLNALGGVGGSGIAGDPLAGMAEGATLQGPSLAAARVTGGAGTATGQAGATDGSFSGSSELEEEMLEELQKMARIQELMLEIRSLEAQAQQQLQDGDQEGASTTQALLQKDQQELAALTGVGQGQDDSSAEGVSAIGSGGGVPAMSGGGGAPSYGGGGGIPSAGSGGGAPTGGGSGPAGDGGSLNAPVRDAGGGSVDVSKDLQPGAAADIPKKYKDNPVAQLIWQESKKAGADPYVMLATAVVESGLNPKAVGDNGTSFGLYQYHQGGALGNRSAEWAFNPKNIIDDEAKRFASAHARNGADAAAVQRPADRAGYARKVDALIAQMRQG